MRRLRTAIAMAVLSSVALAVPGIPATAIELPVVVGSPVEGEVASARGFRGDDGHIFTEAVLETALGRLTVVGRGGRLGDEWEAVEHSPTLAPGALVRLDLERVGTVLRVLGGDSSAGEGGVEPAPQEAGSGDDGVDPVTGRGFTTLFDAGWCYEQLPATYRVESPVPQDWLNAIKRGFASWTAQPSSWVRYRYAGPTASQTAANDGVNRVFFKTTPDADFVARAWTYGSEAGIVGFDIEFNTYFPFTTQGSGLHIETVARHEVGHTLGLGHSGSRRNVMYPTILGNEDKGLGRGDRAGNRGLHPYHDHGVRVIDREPEGTLRLVPGGRATVAVKLANVGRTPWNGPFRHVAIRTDGPRARESRFFDAPTWISHSEPGDRITRLVCSGEVLSVRWAMKAPREVMHAREAFAIRLGDQWMTDQRPVWEVAVPI